MSKTLSSLMNFKFFTFGKFYACKKREREGKLLRCFSRAEGRGEGKLAVYEMFEVINCNFGCLWLSAFLSEVVYDYFEAKT